MQFSNRTLLNSTTWWAVHLSACFSDRGEPYISFFRCLDVFSNELKRFDDIVLEITKKSEYAENSIRSNLAGVKAMFIVGGPLADLNLIQVKNSPRGNTEISLGTPKIPDEVIVFALALARHHKFASRPSVDFAELEGIGLTNFLCLPPTKFRERLKEIERSQRWKDSFSFTQVANLDSLSFTTSFAKDNALISLLQSGKDTWI